MLNLWSVIALEAQNLSYLEGWAYPDMLEVGSGSLELS